MIHLFQASTKKSKSDTSQDDSPSRQRKLKKRPGKPGGAARRSASSGRSFSLTDLSHELNQRIEMMSTLSATDLSPRTLGVTSTYTDPSTTSTSSNATVVPHLLRHDEDNIDPRILEAIRSQISDPSSLPVEFYGALSQITQPQPQNQQSPLRQNQKQSQTSLNSRQSQVYYLFLFQIIFHKIKFLHYS